MDKNKKFFVLYCIFVCITLCVILFSFVTDTDTYKEPGNIDYMKNWKDSEGKEAVFSNISGEYIIENTIPELEKDSIIYLSLKSANISVYIENQCIYETEEFEERLFGKTPGAYFVEVPLTREDSGKTIRMEINNPYSDGAGKITGIYLENGNHLLKNDLAARLPGFCVSVIITFIGVFFILLFILLWSDKTVGMEMLYFGLFALDIGMFMLTDCKFLQEFFGKAHFFHMISEMSMMLIVIPLLMYLERMYKEYRTEKNIFSIVYIYSIANFLICFFLNIFGVADYHKTVWITHISYVGALGVLMGCILWNRKKGEKGNFFHHIGIICITAAAIGDILLLNFGTTLETTFLTRIGVLIFMCMESAQILGKIIRRYKKNVKAQILEKLAYQDGLTELLNRTSFIEDIRDLESEGADNVLVAMFDVNDLKYVNDTFGHTQGDEMLIQVAEQIKRYFVPIGKCYRIGGDEFVLVAEREEAEEIFLQNKKEMDEHLQKINDSGILPFKLSVAAGYAVRKRSDEMTMDELVNTADANMYANKKEMKKKK